MNELTQERNRNFVDVCRRLLREGSVKDTDSRDILVKRALMERPLHYYVSLRRAAEVYMQWQQDSARVPEGLWTDLCRDLDREHELRPWLATSRAIEFVVLFKRPQRFYIAPSTARKILQPYFTTAMKIKQNP